MGAFGGFYESPDHAASGEALRIAPAHHHSHRNGPQQRCIRLPPPPISIAVIDCSLICYWLVQTILAAADDKGRHFGHHCCRRTSPNSIKHRGQYKLINFYINLLNILNHFDSGIRTNTRKAAHPSGGMGSSNPRLER